MCRDRELLSSLPLVCVRDYLEVEGLADDNGVEHTGSQTAWRVAMARVGIGQRETKSTRTKEGRLENGPRLLGNARKGWRDKQGHGCLPFDESRA